MKKFVYLLFLYCILSFFDNLKGILLPFIKDFYQLTNSQAAMFITLGMVVFAVFQLSGGYLLNRFSMKKVQSVSLLVTVIGVLLILFGKNYLIFLLGIALLNLAMANYNVVIAAKGPEISPKRSSTVMNALGISYTLSGILFQCIANTFVAHHTNWQLLYMMVCLLTLLVFIVFIRNDRYFPNEAQSLKEKTKKSPVSWKIIIAFALLVAFYAGAEYSIINWFPSYLQALNFTLQQRTVLQSTFLATRTIGLVIFAILGNRLSPKMALRICMSGAFLLIGGGLLLGSNGAWLIALSGIGFSGAFPAILVKINQAVTTNASWETGKILMFGYLLSAVFNQVLGYAGDNIGFRSIYGIILIFVVMALVLSERIRYGNERDNESIIG